jgi:hypothetical protein
MPPPSFLSRGIFSQLKLIKLILEFCFVGSRRIGAPLMDNWYGTTPIANGPNITLHISMCKCAASLPSPGVVQAKRVQQTFTQNHFSSIRCTFDSNLDVTLFDSSPHLSLPDLSPSRQADAAADRGSTAPSTQGRASSPPGDPAAAAPAAAGGALAPPPASPPPPPPAGAGGCAGPCAAKRPPQVREAPTRF